MFREPRTKSSYMVRVLDMGKLSKEIMIFLISNGVSIEGGTRIKPFADLGVVMGKNGKHYVINTEGCGCGVALEDAPTSIEWYKETVDAKGNVTSFEIMPFVSVKLDKAEFDSTPDNGVKSLDEFIRVFGDRLERNFGNWSRFLATGVKP